MAKRQKTARKATKKRKASTPRKRSADVGARKETTRLKRELAEALQRQAATADVLKVISRSTLASKPDLEAVLETLVESAVRLCGATRGHVFRYDGKFLHFAAAYGASPGFSDWL